MAKSKTKSDININTPVTNEQSEHYGNEEGTYTVPVETSENTTSEMVENAVMESHEYATLFPMLDEAGLAELCADIETNGQTDPIWLYEGKILDGRNRAKACVKLGRKPEIKEYTGDNPLGFVLSKNAHRRHLSESQRAMVASKLATLPAHRPSEKNKSANLPTSPDADSQDTTPKNGGFSQSQVAKLMNVSEKLVRNAVKLRKEAAPEVIEEVEQGKKSINAALANEKPKQNSTNPPAKKSKTVVEEVESVEDMDEDVPETTPVKTVPVKAPKAPSNLNDRIIDELTAALALPMNSEKRSEALLSVFKTINAAGFSQNSARRNFLKGVLTECAEYGVHPIEAHGNNEDAA